MASKRMNVLVYAGTGASLESVRHCLYSLRRVLSPSYAVFTVTGDVLLKEPWMATCALLVFPGGADLGYCNKLNGEGNRRIRHYVSGGGAYLGLCAGGYYGTSKCEFEVGDKSMEVVGERELAFFPGVSRGSAFRGFKYDSEVGTRAVELRVNKRAFPSEGVLPEVFRSYFNGGSVFVDASNYGEAGVETLAEYGEQLDVDSGRGAAAVVYRKVDLGAVILTGPHPEFASVNLSRRAKGMHAEVYEELAANDKLRASFFKACLHKLGLKPSEEEQALPALTPIHVTSVHPEDVEEIMSKLESTSSVVNGEKYFVGAADTFCVQEESSTWSMSQLTKAAISILTSTASKDDDDDPTASFKEDSEERSRTSDRIVDYGEVVKSLIFHASAQPPAKSTPYFNHAAYFSNLAAYYSSPSKRAATGSDDGGGGILGRTLLYGEVVTSTSTLLEKNPSLTDALPHGATLTATTQLSGRGRGSNVWVSPAGSLMFSTVVRHPLALNVTAPVVFVQYLAAMAIAEAVQTYDHAEMMEETNSSSTKVDLTSDLGGVFARQQQQQQQQQQQERHKSTTGASGYRALPIKLKWPNDIYALDPAKMAATSTSASTAAPPSPDAYVKIGGILVNSWYAGGDYTLVVGVGLNVSNAAPTTSLNALVDALNAQNAQARSKRNGGGGAAAAATRPLEAFTLEKLLARVLSKFDGLLATFRRQGFAGELERLYYGHWLHGGQEVTLEEEGGARAVIRGITTDWGLLKAEEVAEGGAGGGSGRRMFALQTDSNSFDFFKGLIKRKI